MNDDTGYRVDSGELCFMQTEASISLPKSKDGL